MQEQQPSHQEAISLLLDNDDISWKSMLYELVKSEQMNPWDVDISLLTQRYIGRIKEMQQMDFRISGKVLLAAAIMLKLKSEYFVEHGIDELDRLFNRLNEPELDPYFFSEFSPELFKTAERLEQFEQRLIPRTPQPRHRKITIYDLAEALQKAMEVNKRKLLRSYPDVKMEIPKRKVDITQVIRGTYGKIKAFFMQDPNGRLTFNHLMSPQPTREEKVYTFIPLLHLDNQRKVDIMQQQHFGDIEIQLLNQRKEVDKELEGGSPAS